MQSWVAQGSAVVSVEEPKVWKSWGVGNIWRPEPVNHAVNGCSSSMKKAEAADVIPSYY